MEKYCTGIAANKHQLNGDFEDVRLYRSEDSFLAEIYSGSLMNALPDGSGNLKFVNGDEYIGEFAEGIINGQGIYIDSKNNRYSGTFKRGKRWGRGKMQYSNGDVFEGDWFDGIWYDMGKPDPLFGEAARLVVDYNQASTSLIQRKLSIGYERAGRIMDQLEAASVIGPFKRSKARNVLIHSQEELDLILSNLL